MTKYESDGLVPVFENGMVAYHRVWYTGDGVTHCVRKGSWHAFTSKFVCQTRSHFWQQLRDRVTRRRIAFYWMELPARHARRAIDHAHACDEYARWMNLNNI